MESRIQTSISESGLTIAKVCGLMKSARFESYRDQAYPRDQSDGTEDGGYRHGLFLVMRDLDRTGVDVLVLVGEAESASREADDAYEQKENSNNGSGFHSRENLSLRQEWDEG
jgi:hypothetical protein